LTGSGLRVAAISDQGLIISNEFGSKRYVEVERNLFRELEPNFTLGRLSNSRQVAFQEGADGEIEGLVFDGRPFASSYKAAWIQTGGFSTTLVKVTLLVFALVLIRAFFQRASYRNANPADKRARGVALFSAGVNILVLTVGASIMARIGANPFAQVPLSFRVFVWLPLVILLAAGLMLLQTTRVWQLGLLAGPFERVRYSVVAACSVAMCWFYAYWNLIGPQYFD